MPEFPPNGQMANEAWPARQNKQHEPFPRKNLGQIADAQYPTLDFILPEKKVMPRGAVTILSGQGGLGKSGIMLQLGAARSLGSQWLGEQVSPGRTLYFNYEDTARVVSDRGIRIAAHNDCAPGDLSEFEVVDRASDGDEWVTFDHSGKMKVTAEFQCAEATIMLSRPELVVVDGASQTYGGNDIDKRQVRQFLQLLNRLAEKYSVAVVLIAHPSKSGLTERTGKSGSEQWFNGSRSFLHFERLQVGDEKKGRDARLLRVTKNNYGPDDLELRLRHLGNGLIGRDGDAQKPAIHTKYDIDMKFLKLLMHFNKTNQNISPSRSNTYAPTVFARQADADGINKHQFEAAMQRLFKTNQIAVEERGSPSKLRKCLVLTDSPRNTTMLMTATNQEPDDVPAVGPSNRFQPNKDGPSNDATNGLPTVETLASNAHPTGSNGCVPAPPYPLEGREALSRPLGAALHVPSPSKKFERGKEESSNQVIFEPLLPEGETSTQSSCLPRIPTPQNQRPGDHARPTGSTGAQVDVGPIAPDSGDDVSASALSGRNEL